MKKARQILGWCVLYLAESLGTIFQTLNAFHVDVFYIWLTNHGLMVGGRQEKER